MKRISLYFTDAKFIKGETLLFLDEIQECGEARTALKFIALGDKFDCIASGSMLGVAYKDIRSIPVGYEKQVEMFAMDFEEYLWARNFADDQISFVKSFFDGKHKVDEAVNNKMFELLREYLVVGGMPAVVKKFVETSDFAQVHETQAAIITSYLDDIAKYAPTPEKIKARACYESIPRQLAKENKKFQYSIVEKNGSARKYDSSLDWLKDAGLIKFCFNTSTPQFPLKSYEKPEYFKVYLTDIGLLTAMHGFEIKKALYQNTLKGPAKGAIYENLVADFLMKRNKPLYYYKRDESRQEIEFLLTADGDVAPLEVKAGNGATLSLDTVIKEFDPPYAYKLITGNLGVAGKKITLPIYMAMFL